MGTRGHGSGYEKVRGRHTVLRTKEIWWDIVFSLIRIFIGSLKISRMRETLSFRPPLHRWDRDLPLQGPRPNLRPILETSLRIRASVWPPPVLWRGGYSRHRSISCPWCARYLGERDWTPRFCTPTGASHNCRRTPTWFRGSFSSGPFL